jgi:carbamoylphosphate synthase small subunit
MGGVEPSDTKMFASLGERAHTFSELNITFNNHNYGLKPETFFTDEGLGNFFRPTAVSYDDNGDPFVATMEAYDYPFYAVEFHPEVP